MVDAVRVEPVTGLVVLGNEGMLTYEKWEAVVLGLIRADPHPTTRRRILSDRRRTAPLAYGMVDRILTFLHQRAAELGEVQWALLAPPGSQVHEVLKLGEAFAATPHVRLKAFTDLDDGLRWLLGAYEEEELSRLACWVENTT